MRLNKSLIKRFWEKVKIKQNENCWEWMASIKPSGYGQIRINGRTEYAHRVSYELAYGEIPSGMLVRHKCDNPLCVRPEHLEIGTQFDNMLDMKSRGRARHVGMPGERNPSAKISDVQMVEIISSKKCSLSELASKYGVTKQRICQIRKQYQLDKDGEFVECE